MPEDMELLAAEYQAADIGTLIKKYTRLSYVCTTSPRYDDRFQSLARAKLLTEIMIARGAADQLMFPDAYQIIKSNLSLISAFKYFSRREEILDAAAVMLPVLFTHSIPASTRYIHEPKKDLMDLLISLRDEKNEKLALTDSQRPKVLNLIEILEATGRELPPEHKTAPRAKRLSPEEKRLKREKEVAERRNGAGTQVNGASHAGTSGEKSNGSNGAASTEFMQSPGRRSQDEIVEELKAAFKVACMRVERLCSGMDFDLAAKKLGPLLAVKTRSPFVLAMHDITQYADENSLRGLATQTRRDIIARGGIEHLIIALKKSSMASSALVRNFTPQIIEAIDKLAERAEWIKGHAKLRTTLSLVTANEGEAGTLARRLLEKWGALPAVAATPPSTEKAPKFSAPENT